MPAADPARTTADSPRRALMELVRSGPDANDLVATERFERLLEIVDGLGSCVLALSGGIDSSFLLAVASQLLGERCLALTGDSAAMPTWDRADAATAAGEAGRHGARWRTIATKELDDPRYARNPRSRCYYCKLEVYGAAAAIAQAEGYAWIVDGTNASDTRRADRPGMTAASELGVRSPLAEAGIEKEQLRALARSIGIDGWDRPASACLASRIPFGELITAERLRRVEAAELALRGLGFRQVRVRDFGSHARVEVEAGDLENLRSPFIPVEFQTFFDMLAYFILSLSCPGLIGIVDDRKGLKIEASIVILKSKSESCSMW